MCSHVRWGQLDRAQRGQQAHGVQTGWRGGTAYFDSCSVPLVPLALCEIAPIRDTSDTL